MDKWDYSPLILTSLCGHKELVELLLENGATVNRDTFDGARAIYGALTDEIRDILLSYDIDKAVDVNQPFAAHISGLLQKPKFTTADLIFGSAGGFGSGLDIRVHWFVLLALTKLSNRGECDVLREVDVNVVKIIVDHLYLVTIDERLINKVDFRQLKNTCARLGLDELIRYLEVTADSDKDLKERVKIRNEYQRKLNQRTKTKLKLFLEDKILKHKLIKHDGVEITPSEKLELIKNNGADVILKLDRDQSIEGEETTLVYYPAHRSILSRADYYETLFKTASSPDFAFSDEISIFTDEPVFDPENNIINLTHFETHPDEIPVISLPIDFNIYSHTYDEVVEKLLAYLYHDEVEIEDDAMAIDLILLSDSLLIDRLKTTAAVALTQLSTKKVSIYEVLRVGWLTRLPRLEHHVAYILAQDLSKYIKQKEFKKAVKESSERLDVRQEFDSIELIDDIRYFLGKKYHIDEDADEILNAMFAKADYVDEVAVSQYDRDLDSIDELLEELGLKA
ncbi:unnamed protein product [Ambrosiozyma monospora]|uniref:Unnamed protein product n=1 Tax=Ambrosiozyma monospora TaxID=43982 RepID=A0ACB5STT1_AMBMO|nr:unnamed protein product [Ambrosiozyma monospora]